MVLPTDSIFRNAWTWEGKNKPVIENLESSKAIAIAAMRDQTTADVKAAAEAKFFSDDVPFDEAAIKDLYERTEAEVIASDDVYGIKCILCAFMGWDEPPLPRREELKAEAENLIGKLRAKLEKIREEIAQRPSTLPAPIPGETEDPPAVILPDDEKSVKTKKK